MHSLMNMKTADANHWQKQLDLHATNKRLKSSHNKSVYVYTRFQEVAHSRVDTFTLS